MKKTIIAILAVSGLAMAADLTEDVSYTWDFANPGAAVMGGNMKSADSALGVTEAVLKDGTNGLVLTGTTQSYDERNTTAFYDMINSAFNGAGTFSLTFDIKWVDNPNYQALVHVGRFGYGVTMGIVRGELTFGVGGNGDGGHQYNEFGEGNISSSVTLTSGTWQTAAITLSGNTVTTYIDGVVAGTGTISAMDWYPSEYNDYSIATKAPGYVNADTVGSSQISNLTASFKVNSVPEPATATLSLLALAGLAARRKRH